MKSLCMALLIIALVGCGAPAPESVEPEAATETAEAEKSDDS